MSATQSTDRPAILTDTTPVPCTHTDPSGHDRACECRSCDLCEWPTDLLYRQADGSLVCLDCVEGEE